MISIIIPAHNEENYILKTIESIKRQSFKDYEIIVVDDGSYDKTFQRANRNADFVVKLNKKSGPAKARNTGVKKASGSILVFLDADTLLSENVLNEVWNNKNNYDVGTCRIMPDKDKLKHKIMMALKNKLLCPFGVSNGILFCSRANFDKYGPFNEKMQKREEGALLRTIKKNGRFIILEEPVVSSMRRFDNKGYSKIFLYWIKEAIKPSKDDYEIIR